MSDLISKQAIIDNIKTRLYQTALNNLEDITSYAKVCEDIAENRIDTWVNEVKTVEPERKPGKWIDGKCNRCGTNAPFWAMATTYYCSEYCPKCGAKMEVKT